MVRGVAVTTVTCGAGRCGAGVSLEQAAGSAADATTNAILSALLRKVPPCTRNLILADAYSRIRRRAERRSLQASCLRHARCRLARSSPRRAGALGKD